MSEQKIQLEIDRDGLSMIDMGLGLLSAHLQRQLASDLEGHEFLRVKRLKEDVEGLWNRVGEMLKAVPYGLGAPDANS